VQASVIAACRISLVTDVVIMLGCIIYEGEESSDRPGKLYKPTSKLLEKTSSSSKVPSLLKSKDEEKPERPV